MKRILCILGMLTFIVSMLFCLSGCSAKQDNDGIVHIVLVSSAVPGNGTHLSEEREADHEHKALKSETAGKLIKEVLSIPDDDSQNGDFAYQIRLTYREHDKEVTVKKTGYGSYPDNWDSVISLANEMFSDFYGQPFILSGSKEIAHVDADYVRKNCAAWIDERVVPEGMTLDSIIEGMDMDYLTLFDPEFYPNNQKYLQNKIEEYIDRQKNPAESK